MTVYIFLFFFYPSFYSLQCDRKGHFLHIHTEKKKKKVKTKNENKQNEQRKKKRAGGGEGSSTLLHYQLVVHIKRPSSAVACTSWTSGTRGLSWHHLSTTQKVSQIAARPVVTLDGIFYSQFLTDESEMAN